MTLDEIKNALSQGKRVYCGRPGVWVFEVCYPSGRRELVVGDDAYHVGLVRGDGTLNGKNFGIL